MGDKKRADPSLSIDTDLLILEYLVYNATSSVIEFRRNECKTNQTASEDEQSAIFNHLNMVDSFLVIFSNDHPSHSSGGQTLKFHLALLRFTSLFALRNPSTSHLVQPSPDSLHEKRQNHRQRAQRWCETFGRDTWIAQLDRSGDQLKSYTPSPPNAACLMDLIPQFMWLTALRAKLGDKVKSNSIREDEDEEMASSSSSQSSANPGWQPSSQWVDLAQEFMLQAFLEQVLDHHRKEYAPLVEAFAWGIPSSTDVDVDMDSAVDEASANDPVTPRDVNILLEPAKNLDKLLSYRDWIHIRAARPARRFEQDTLGFLQGLLESYPPPVLVQLERGEDAVLVEDDKGSGKMVEVSGDEVEALKKLASLNLG